MNNVTALPNVSIEPVETMTSLDFLNNYINPARLEAGESVIENRKFLKKVEDEIEDLPDGKKVRLALPQGGYNEVTAYDLNYDQCMLVGMRESKAVRRAVLAKLNALMKPKPMTQMEMLLAQAQAMVNAERQLAQQNQRLAAIESKVEKIQDLSEQLLPGYLPIKVAWREHCNLCSYDTFRDFVTATQMPTKPLVHVPDGTVVVVRTHQVKVSNVKKLANDIRWRSQQVTKTLWTHPELNSRFKYRG